MANWRNRFDLLHAVIPGANSHEVHLFESADLIVEEEIKAWVYKNRGKYFGLPESYESPLKSHFVDKYSSPYSKTLF